MTVEAKIPLNDLKDCLYNYSCLYNVCNNPKDTLDYKTTVARKTISSLLFSFFKIILFGLVIMLACNTDSDSLLMLLWVVVAIVLGILVLTDLFYVQHVSDKKHGKVRFRYTYYIKCIVQDFYEIGWFRRYFGVKTSTFTLIYGSKNSKAEAYRNIEDWGYMVGADYIKVIDRYNHKYWNYREYVNFDDMWHLCGELLSIINSGRATDVQSALAVVDRNAHMKRLEKIEQDKADRIVAAQERASEAVQEVAWAQAQAAYSVDEAARAARDWYRNHN